QNWSASGGDISQTGNRYVFAYQPTLTFSSTSFSKIYGADGAAALANAYAVSGYEPAVSGVYLADSATTAWSGLPTLTSAGSATSAGVGGSPYGISVAAGTLSSSAGYALAFSSSGQLTVTPAPLTIIADDVTKSYDGLAFSGGGGLHYAGFVNGDTQASLSGSLLWSGTAQGARDAGSYGIAASGLANPNY
ncbi:MBG domain-containing protein, partial [Sphingobium sp. Sx8-8]|uniref:MBG domain-containing protein n=1 Tax=Sphingobium sp. Sx8-8 TaxID=2933617 RepID=UPI001F571012